jgi:hypothetical protein
MVLLADFERIGYGSEKRKRFEGGWEWGDILIDAGKVIYLVYYYNTSVNFYR